jgi:hypothetical protein
MAGAATGKDTNFSFHGGIYTYNIIGIVVDPYQVRMSQGNTLKLFHYDVFGFINQFFHTTSFLPIILISWILPAVARLLNY